MRSPASMYLGSMIPRNLRSGHRLKVYFCKLAPREMPPPEQEQRRRSDEPDVRPGWRESGVRVSGHAPQREDEHPPVDHEATPEQLEADVLVDQIVGIELDALEDEVVHDVEGEKRRIQEDARVGVFAKEFIVVHGPGQGVERQHRPPDDIEIHLDVEAVVEELQLLGPPEPQRQADS